MAHAGGVRILLLLLLLPFALACHRPRVEPPAPVQLTVHFLDRDAGLGLPVPAPEGAWAFMDAGLWRPLEVLWKAGRTRGSAVVPRTAPSWVLLRDPEGEVHRIELDPLEGGGELGERLDAEEREWLASVGLLWVLSWIRR